MVAGGLSLRREPWAVHVAGVFWPTPFWGMPAHSRPHGCRWPRPVPLVRHVSIRAPGVDLGRRWVRHLTRGVPRHVLGVIRYLLRLGNQAVGELPSLQHRMR